MCMGCGVLSMLCSRAVPESVNSLSVKCSDRRVSGGAMRARSAAAMRDLACTAPARDKVFMFMFKVFVFKFFIFVFMVVFVCVFMFVFMVGERVKPCVARDRRRGFGAGRGSLPRTCATCSATTWWA